MCTAVPALRDFCRSLGCSLKSRGDLKQAKTTRCLWDTSLVVLATSFTAYQSSRTPGGRRWLLDTPAFQRGSENSWPGPSFVRGEL
jgi:hypothetical protein